MALIEECERVGSKEGWLACPQQTQLTEDSDIGRAIGAPAINALRKHQPVMLNGIRVVAYTERQLPSIGNGSPILAVHISAGHLAKLDSLYEVPSLIVVPWNPEADTRAWRTKWSPQTISV
jgi:hypothetical protein